MKQNPYSEGEPNKTPKDGLHNLPHDRKEHKVLYRYRLMQEMYEKGESLEEIAKHFKMHRSTIRKAMRLGWVPKRSEKKNSESKEINSEKKALTFDTRNELITTNTKNTLVIKEKWDQWKQLYEHRVPIVEIARMYGVTGSTVINARDNDWVPRNYGKNNKEKVIMLKEDEPKTSVPAFAYDPAYIKERYTQGAAADRISRESGTPLSFVWGVLRKENITRPSTVENFRHQPLRQQDINECILKLKAGGITKEEVESKYVELKSHRKVARWYGISVPMVTMALKIQGTRQETGGTSRLSHEDKIEIGNMIISGHTDKQIAEKYKMTITNVRYYIRRQRTVWTREPEYDWTRRPEYIPESEPLEQPRTVSVLEIAVPPSAEEKQVQEETASENGKDRARKKLEKFVASGNPDSSMSIDKKVSDRMRLLGAKGGRAKSNAKRIASKQNALKRWAAKRKDQDSPS